MDHSRLPSRQRWRERFAGESERSVHDRSTLLVVWDRAFNVAPNRTLQSVGFSYVKTYETVPGPLNYHQPVTRWVFEKSPGDR